MNRNGRRVKVTFQRCSICRYEQEIAAVDVGAASRSDHIVDSNDATTWVPPRHDDAFTPMPGGDADASDDVLPPPGDDPPLPPRPSAPRRGGRI